jgi:hypothetical protein
MQPLKERPGSYRRTVSVIRRASEPDFVVETHDGARVVIECKRLAAMPSVQQPNPFLMGAGLVFNFGSIFRAISSSEALAVDAATVGRDMRRAFCRLITKVPNR